MKKHFFFLSITLLLFACKKASQPDVEKQSYNEAALPTAIFRVANTINSDGVSVKAGTILCIENNSENAISYLWEYDDNKTSTEKFPPSLALNNCGSNRAIKLTTKNADGKTATITKYYNVVCGTSGR